MKLRVKYPLTKEQADFVCNLVPLEMCQIKYKCSHNRTGCAGWSRIDEFKRTLIEIKYKKQEKQNG